MDLDTMSSPPAEPQCYFLQLPLDIRNRIYELIFFAKDKKQAGGLTPLMSEFEARKLNWASTGLVGTTVNQIHPYRRDSKYQPQYDLRIFRANHQIQEEAERVFYSWSSFNLTGDAYAPGELPTFQFFESLPRRNRRLIRRVEIRCFYRSAHRSQPGNWRLMSLFDWDAFMKFLAGECPSLRSLTLWGFADGVEGEDLKRSCRLSSDWVQSILQIKSLLFFDIRAIPRRRIAKDQSCVPETLHQLRSLLYNHHYDTPQTSPNNPPIPIPSATSPFPLLHLPLHLRKRIYRFVLLPPNKTLHPYLKSWYDITPRSAIPLFLISHQIHREAESVLYSESLFVSPAHKYDQSLLNFIQTLPPHLLPPHYHIITYQKLISPFIDLALAHKQLTTFHYTHKPPHDTDTDTTLPPQQTKLYKFIAEDLHKPWPLKRINIQTNDSTTLSPFIRVWITQRFIDLGAWDEGHLILRLDW